MDIRLIALDLDGTLLDSQKRLSSRNKVALTECLRRGIHIVPTTGRTVSGIPSGCQGTGSALCHNDERRSGGGHER